MDKIKFVQKEVKTVRVSEIFYSLQGEGLRVGVPSIFVRFFGCNFRCPGFGMPKGEISTEADDIVKQVLSCPQNYPDYQSLPLAKTGCDSYPSWHPKLAQYSNDVDQHQLMSMINNIMPKTTNLPDIVFTGGEPLLPRTQSFIASFLRDYSDRFNYITFETNGTMLLTEQLKTALLSKNKIIFSISPKLSCSGVPKNKAINYDVWKDINWFVSNTTSRTCYLKFVISNEDDVQEIEDVLQNCPIDVPGVYVMPEGGTTETYNANCKIVADIALKYGYVFSPRLHVSLYGNSWAK